MESKKTTPLEDEVKTRLEEGLKLHFFHFNANGSGCGIKAAAVVVSDDFKDVTRVNR